MNFSDMIEKAKYISRKRVGNKYVYKYADDKKGGGSNPRSLPRKSPGPPDEKREKIQRIAEDQYEAVQKYTLEMRKMRERGNPTERISTMANREKKRIMQADSEKDYLRSKRVGEKIALTREMRRQIYRYFHATKKLQEMTRSPLEGTVMSMPTGSIKKG